MARARATPAATPVGTPVAHAERAPLLQRLAERITRPRGPQAGDVRLVQRNVFVLPTRAGMLYGAVLVTMLVASINYALSLGFMLTFLLASVAIVAMLHTFRNLSALVLRPGRAEAVHAGQPAEFSLLVINPGNVERFAIRLHAPGMARPEVVDLSPNAEHLIRIAIPAPRRGWLHLPRLTMWTEYPLGLWRVWAMWHPALRVLVYPAPETPAVALPEFSTVAGDGIGRYAGEDDVAAVRPYRDGDSPRRIAWKAMARTASEALLSKQYDSGERGELRLDWHLLRPEMDVEAKISRLTRWVLDADAAGARWSLALPGRTIPLDGGPGHRERCLEALATLEA